MDGNEVTSDANRPPRPGVAATLSTIIPGAGQWYAGYLRRGLVVAAPLVLIAVSVVALLRRGAIGTLELAVQPVVLWMLLAVNVVVLAWRLFAVVDAYRLSKTERVSRWVGALVVGLVVLVALPHVVVGAYGLRGAMFIDRVFVANGAGAAAANTIAPPSPEADLVPDPAGTSTTTTVPPSTTVAVSTTTTEAAPRRNLLFREGFGDPEAVAVRPEIVESDHAAPFLPFEERIDDTRLTFLLAGGDAGPGRGGLRTDTIMVATIDLETGQAAIFGIPRNMGQIPMPKRFEGAFVEMQKRLAPESDPSTWVDVNGDGIPDEPEFESCDCFPEQINALYAYTRKWTRSFPNEVDPGMAALREVTEHMLGLHIDYYVLVDMQAFVALVEAVGGVDVYVKEALEAEVSPPEEGAHWATVDVQPGWNHLSGTEALAYARARKGSSDYARMERQRCLLRGVAGEADPLTMLRSFPAIADAIERYVVTDVPVSFLPDLVRAAATLDVSKIATVGFNPPYYAPVRDHKYHAIPDLDRIRWKVKRVLNEGVVAQSSDGISECDPDQ
ncbi:MAG: LCP family protein [Actinomycetota bacterium]